MGENEDDIDCTLPPWMISILTEEEEKLIKQQQQIPLYIPQPMSKEEIREESDIIEDTLEKQSTFIEFDI